jgi:hypothetical protein
MKNDLSRLFDTLTTDELTHWEIQQTLAGRTVEEIKNLRDGMPLLHSACAWAFEYIGARRLLLVFFEDPILRQLFIDSSYTDQYGWTAHVRLCGMNGHSTKSTNWCIIDDILREFDRTKLC